VLGDYRATTRAVHRRKMTMLMVLRVG
jgi:hypothetical protein